VTCERCRFLLAEYEKRATMFGASVKTLNEQRTDLSVEQLAEIIADIEEIRRNTEFAIWRSKNT
jgi:methylphosphotriester-DNA--protein-cysteine methyltransferase